MILSVAFLKVLKQGLRWSVRSLNQHVIADEKTSVIDYPVNITRVSGAVELCVMVQVDLSFDRAAAFDGNRAASKRRQFFVRSVDQQAEIACS